MDTIMRTPVRKHRTLHFLVDGVQVWASYLDVEGDGPYGVDFKWMAHKYDVTPLEHVTRDEGQTYQQVENFIFHGGEGVEKRPGVTETDPEKLKALQRIWTAYHQELERRDPATKSTD
jgi:hypothetical protein